MSNTPNLDLPYILPAQAQKHVTHNEAIRTLDALVQMSATRRDLQQPPAEPAEGERFIVAAPSSGVWEGQEGRIAAWQDGAWAFLTPRTGWLAWVAQEALLLAHDGIAWVEAAPAKEPNPALLVGVNATADENHRLSVSAPASLFSHEGAGHQLKVNKAAAADTGSLLFQTGWSGRAEMGLAGDDDFHVKVSADGTTWNEAIVIERATGAVSLPNTAQGTGPAQGGSFWLPSRGPASLTGLATHQAGYDTGIAALSSAWMMVFALPVGRQVTVGSMSVRVEGAAADQIGLALYASEADDAPGALLAGFGTASCASAGLKTLQASAPLTLSAGLYWVAAMVSAGTATFRGNSFTRDIGFGAAPAGTLIRSGLPFRVNTATHGITFFNPPATLAALETKSGQLDPFAMHCPAVLVQ